MAESPIKEDGRQSKTGQEAESNSKNRIQSISNGYEVHVYMLRQFVGCLLESRYDRVRGQAVGLYGAVGPPLLPNLIRFRSPVGRGLGTPLAPEGVEARCKRIVTNGNGGRQSGNNDSLRPCSEAKRGSPRRPDEVIRGNASTSHKLLFLPDEGDTRVFQRTQAIPSGIQPKTQGTQPIS